MSVRARSCLRFCIMLSCWDEKTHVIAVYNAADIRGAASPATVARSNESDAELFIRRSLLTAWMS